MNSGTIGRDAQRGKRVMRGTWKLRSLGEELRFWEDDESEQESEESDDAEEEESGDEEQESDESDEEEEDDSKKGKKKLSPEQQLKSELAKLQSVVRKERMARRKAERDARAARRQAPKPKAPIKKGAKAEDTDDEELAAAAAERLAAEGRVTRLANRVRESAVDNVIIRLAPKLNFADPEDAVAMVNRKDIEVDQDDEDLTDVEIDEDSVRDALKKLAKRKPHLLAKSKTNGTGDEEDDDPKRTTGSKFGGKRRTKDALSEEELRRTYPALGPRRV